MALPSFFMLQSRGRYLSVTENVPANLPSGLVKFDEEQIWSPRAKFAAEPAADGSGLFHIRSLYNNKYLVTKQIESNSWLVASAKKPEEDKSQASSCTLFEPHSLAAAAAGDDDTTTVRLRHVGTGISVTHSDSHDHHHQGAVLLLSSSIIGSSFIVKDSASVVVLPSRIAFKSQDLNSSYLGTVFLYDNLPYQKFDSGFDVGDQNVAKELVPTPDGNYRIHDLKNGKFWKRINNWIKAEAGGDDNSPDTLFSFVQIENNVFGLRNLGNKALCGAYTESESIDCLCAFYPTLSKQTKLILVEPVIRREIKDVEYRISDSRIYNEKVVALGHQFGTNDSQGESETMTLQFSVGDSKTTSWNNSTTLQYGLKVEFDVTFIPLIFSTKIELSVNYGQTTEWGGSETTEETIQTSYTVTVPPSKTIKVTMLATKGFCDVPFSYTQRDLLPSGEWVETRKDDGLFAGANSSDIRYKSELLPNS